MCMIFYQLRNVVGHLVEIEFSLNQLRLNMFIYFFVKKKYIHYRRQLNQKKHKTLKVIYQSNKTQQELLELIETVSIHQQQLRFLVTEGYESNYYLYPKFLCSFFTHKEIPYNLRKGQLLSLPPARSTYYGTNSVHFQGYLISNNLPSYIKCSRSVYEFKNNIKNFRDIDYGCLICRTRI